MKRKSGKVRHVGALLASIAIVSGCGAPPPSNQQGKGRERLELTPLNDETCEGIFDDEVLSELKDLNLSRAYIPGEGRAFFDTFTIYMNKSMKPSDPRLTHGCVVRDKTGKKTLIDITVDWAQGAFPAKAKMLGRETYYSIDLTPEGKRRDQLLVDCQRPDLARKNKKNVAMQVRMESTLALSSRARVSLLNSAANEVTEGLYCKNKVAYPDPNQVARTTR